MLFFQRRSLLMVILLVIESIAQAILKNGKTNLEEGKQIPESTQNIDVFQLNVGGEIIITTRETLTKVPKSILSLIFNGQWESKRPKDANGYIFFDFNPILFRHLLDQLQTIETTDRIQLHPPSQPSLLEPFTRMIRKLGLDQSLSPERKNVVTFNVGGQMRTHRRTTFSRVLSNSSSLTAISPRSHHSDIFLDYDPKLFQQLINQLREDLSTQANISSENLLRDMNTLLKTTRSNHTKWKENGLTIAGGNGNGNQSNQLSSPSGIYVDDDHECIYVADTRNDRIVQWKSDAKTGQVVAGGNQLDHPTDIIVDNKTDSLIICDRGNRRVVQWPRRNVKNGKIIISDIDCHGLTMDNNGDLYVTDFMKNEVRRWKIGETKGTLVAGENGKGNQMNQLNSPLYVYVDTNYSIYVSDYYNHRVMKWMKGAKAGFIVAGGQGQGNSLTQLSSPHGVIVDQFGHVYVADTYTDRIVRWSRGSKEGYVIVSGNDEESQADQFSAPMDLSFDRQGNLYVLENKNPRVQKFEIDFISTYFYNPANV